jgi:hypothetical protein
LFQDIFLILALFEVFVPPVTFLNHRIWREAEEIDN